MKTRLRIPVYSNLSPKHKQYVNMAAGGTGMLIVALVVSGMIGGPEVPSAAPKELPKPRPLTGVPGAQLDAKDAWMGGAGKELAQVRDQLKQSEEERNALRADLKQTRDQFTAELNALRERGLLPPTPAKPAGSLPPLAVTPAPAASAPAADAARTAVPAAAAGATAATLPLRGPSSFPVQANRDRLPAPAAGTYPPGTPVGTVPQAGAGGFAESAPAPLMRVSLSGSRTDGAGLAPGAAPSPAAAGGPVKAARHVGTVLPVGFTRATLLGGLAAPTGGQAQNNPVPVLLRMSDLSVLPNGYRAQVKDCLVIGEGYGEHSAERAYIRATLLSCVMRDGQVLEVPIKGSVFGEDGMNGMMGKLVTKQGAILGNALLAGIASGIGSGIAQASQITTTTALGSVTTQPADTSSILKQGFGTGVGKALDRLSQYYINLAERTFPVIEVLPGRVVDIVIQQGVPLDVAIAAIGPAPAAQPTRGLAPDNDRSALVKVAHGEDED